MRALGAVAKGALVYAGRSWFRSPISLVLAGALALVGGCWTPHPSGPHGPVCPVIEDVSHIVEYPTDRLRILKRVAARPELSTHEQIYLVNAVMAVGFSSDKAVALVTLIENPCCTAETRQHIRKSLKLARMLGRDERQVIDALEKVEKPATP
jgi:hypothetical protein